MWPNSNNDSWTGSFIWINTVLILKYMCTFTDWCRAAADSQFTCAWTKPTSYVSTNAWKWLCMHAVFRSVHEQLTSEGNVRQSWHFYCVALHWEWTKERRSNIAMSCPDAGEPITVLTYGALDHRNAIVIIADSLGLFVKQSTLL